MSAGGAAEHPGHDAEVGLHSLNAGLVDLLAVDGEGAGEGDADAVDFVKIAVGSELFVAVEVINGNLADFGEGGHVELGADLLAVGECCLQVVEALAACSGGAEELDFFTFDLGIKEMATGGGVADEVEGIGLGHGLGLREPPRLGFAEPPLLIKEGSFFGRCGGTFLEGVELPSVGAVVGHDNAPAVACEDDDFAVVGLFLECGEAEHALREVEGAVEADALDLLPVFFASEVLLVVVTEDGG